MEKVRNEELDVKILSNYLNETRSIRLTAEIFNVSHSTVHRILVAYGIDTCTIETCPRCLGSYKRKRCAANYPSEGLCPECASFYPTPDDERLAYRSWSAMRQTAE